MSKELTNNNIDVTELEKIADILEVCIDNLYDERVSNHTIVYILEMISDKLSIIKNEAIKSDLK